MADPGRRSNRGKSAKYAEEWPAWGYRKVAALMRADGYEVTNSSVQRALRRRGLLLPQGFRADRRSWAALRRRVFHDPPTERNRVWQTDFSEFETATVGFGESAPSSTTSPNIAWPLLPRPLAAAATPCSACDWPSRKPPVCSTWPTYGATAAKWTSSMSRTTSSAAHLHPSP